MRRRSAIEKDAHASNTCFAAFNRSLSSSCITTGLLHRFPLFVGPMCRELTQDERAVAVPQFPALEELHFPAVRFAVKVQFTGHRRPIGRAHEFEQQLTRVRLPSWIRCAGRFVERIVTHVPPSSHLSACAINLSGRPSINSTLSGLTYITAVPSERLGIATSPPGGFGIGLSSSSRTVIGRHPF